MVTLLSGGGAAKNLEKMSDNATSVDADAPNDNEIQETST